MRSVKHLNMSVRHNDRMNENERFEGMIDEFFFKRMNNYYTSPYRLYSSYAPFSYNTYPIDLTYLAFFGNLRLKKAQTIHNWGRDTLTIRQGNKVLSIKFEDIDSRKKQLHDDLERMESQSSIWHEYTEPVDNTLMHEECFSDQMNSDNHVYLIRLESNFSDKSEVTEISQQKMSQSLQRNSLSVLYFSSWDISCH